jgi:diaminohydroxyphosphoribosylaminopyrimidine deaminase/5-amino-6-(5-phosphoribosylamino)uracil reductase
MDHKDYMRRALELAVLGLGQVHPNPLVGAVIVKDGRIIAEGYHAVYGGPHAEVQAFQNAVEDVKGATMYVTLEPCSHHGKTPPCADEIVRQGIRDVYVAMQDPNPLVSGQGIAILKQAGVHVQTGILKRQAKEMNERFLHFMKTKRPYVTVKSAMSQNGKITSATNRWVTGEAARHRVHELRATTKAVMVGAATVLADDPMLNVRTLEARTQPLRVVLDSQGRTPSHANVVKTASQIPTWIYVKEGVDDAWKQHMEEQGVVVIELAAATKRLSLSQVFDHLGQHNIDDVLIEPGATLLQTLIRERWIQRWLVFRSPHTEPESEISFLPYPYVIDHHYQPVKSEWFGDDRLTTYLAKEAN